MPIRLSKIDELTRSDHSFLVPRDICYYLGEYTAHAGYRFSETNDLIQNLKKPMGRRDEPEWKWKTRAIQSSAEMLREALPEEWFGKVTFVPVPPSMTKDHPEYDDRLVQILHRLGEGRTLDVRELIVMIKSIDPAHLRSGRRSVNELVRHMRIDRSLMEPRPAAICVFDDVLTTGAHFKAVEMILHAHFAHVPLAGLFLARRTPSASLI